VDERPSDEAWRMLAENLSQACTMRSVPWVMANGLRVEQYAKKALDINSGNPAAQYLIAARWVYAPPPLNNLKRGIRMREDIAVNCDRQLEKDDRFNVYSDIGYGYLQQKKYADAKIWLQKSLDIYPSNKFVRDLLDKC
jgi:tetratricopeptide (TPR) repeat protein